MAPRLKSTVARAVLVVFAAAFMAASSSPLLGVCVGGDSCHCYSCCNTLGTVTFQCGNGGWWIAMHGIMPASLLFLSIAVSRSICSLPSAPREENTGVTQAEDTPISLTDPRSRMNG